MEALAPIIEHLTELKRSNHVWVATMRELASYREARGAMKVRLEKGPRKELLSLECPLDRQRFGDPEVSLVVSRLEPPRTVSALKVGASEPATLQFRYDEQRRAVTFNVSSSASTVCIE